MEEMEDKKNEEMECKKEVTLKNLFYAGVGALAESLDKSKELYEHLVKKGEEATEKGKVVNAELKHKMEEKIKENVEVKVVKEEMNTADDILKAIKNLGEDELKALKEKLAENENGEEGKAQE